MQDFIYTITCTADSKVYVGRTCNHKRRKREHFKKLLDNNHHNKHLQAAYNKYGKEVFCFSVVEEVSKKVIKERELFWFNKLIGEGVALFNHEITSSSGGVNARSVVTRSYIFDVLDVKYNERLSIPQTCKRFNTTGQTLQDYTPEWEQLRGLKMHGHTQVESTLERLRVFVEVFKQEGREAYRRLKDFGLSHQALVKHLPKFGLSFDDVRLDEKFRTTKERALKAVEEVKAGAKREEACKANDISTPTFYKYLKEHQC